MKQRGVDELLIYGAICDNNYDYLSYVQKKVKLVNNCLTFKMFKYLVDNNKIHFENLVDQCLRCSTLESLKYIFNQKIKFNRTICIELNRDMSFEMIEYAYNNCEFKMLFYSALNRRRNDIIDFLETKKNFEYYMNEILDNNNYENTPFEIPDIKKLFDLMIENDYVKGYKYLIEKYDNPFTFDEIDEKVFNHRSNSIRIIEYLYLDNFYQKNNYNFLENEYIKKHLINKFVKLPFLCSIKKNYNSIYNFDIMSLIFKYL